VLQGINGIQSTEDHSLDVYPVNVLVIQAAVNQILVRPNKINYLVLWPLFLEKNMYPVNVLVIQEAVNQTLVRPSKVNSIAKEIFWAEIYRGQLFLGPRYIGGDFFRGETRRSNDCPYFK
jgi:hypothetical protein